MYATFVFEKQLKEKGEYIMGKRLTSLLIVMFLAISLFACSISDTESSTTKPEPKYDLMGKEYYKHDTITILFFEEEKIIR